MAKLQKSCTSPNIRYYDDESIVIIDCTPIHDHDSSSPVTTRDLQRFNIKDEVKKIRRDVTDIKHQIASIERQLKLITEVLMNHKAFIESHCNESCE